MTQSIRLRRSVLSVPAINPRALDKTHSLDCDAVIFDLEDSVSPEKKADARNSLRTFFSGKPLENKERIIRINALSSTFGPADMDLVQTLQPDAVLLPKVDDAQDISAAEELLAKAGAPDTVRIWAMIETPRGVINADTIGQATSASASRLDCFVVGLNDLRKETGVLPEPDRTYLVPWLMQVVLAARANNLDVIDSVHNDFNDHQAFERECQQGRKMAFDGKMLIHPAQILPANLNFAPNDQEVAEAEAIIAVLNAPENEGLNVVNHNGKMIERLHLSQAEKVVGKDRMIKKRSSQF
jgi:citrate lyase subunit beta/citryl-CoA lyase